MGVVVRSGILLSLTLGWLKAGNRAGSTLELAEGALIWRVWGTPGTVGPRAAKARHRGSLFPLQS